MPEYFYNVCSSNDVLNWRGVMGKDPILRKLTQGNRNGEDKHEVDDLLVNLRFAVAHFSKAIKRKLWNLRTSSFASLAPEILASASVQMRTRGQKLWIGTWIS